jgi:hypothetical protein
VVPPQYPFRPPVVKSLSDVRHPQIDSITRFVQSPILSADADWRPVLSLNTVILALQLLFLDTNDGGGLERQRSHQHVIHPMDVDLCRASGGGGGGGGAEDDGTWSAASIKHDTLHGFMWRNGASDNLSQGCFVSGLQSSSRGGGLAGGVVPVVGFGPSVHEDPIDTTSVSAINSLERRHHIQGSLGPSHVRCVHRSSPHDDSRSSAVASPSPFTMTDENMQQQQDNHHPFPFLSQSGGLCPPELDHRSAATRGRKRGRELTAGTHPCLPEETIGAKQARFEFEAEEHPTNVCTFRQSHSFGGGGGHPTEWTRPHPVPYQPQCTPPNHAFGSHPHHLQGSSQQHQHMQPSPTQMGGGQHGGQWVGGHVFGSLLR